MVTIFHRTDEGAYGLPVGDWLIYAFALTAPFFVFALFFGRDTASFWIVVLMLVLLLFETARRGGGFPVDRSYVFLALMLFTYVIATLIVYFEGTSGNVLGRSPLDRALTTDLRLVNMVVAFVVFTSLLFDAPPKIFTNVLKIQLAIGAGLALFGILQYVMYIAFNSTALAGIEPTNESYLLRASFFRVAGRRVFRTMSIFNEPSFFGFFLIPVTVKAVVTFFQKVPILPRRLHIGLIGLLLVAIITNFSFTAVLSTIGMVLLFGALSIRHAPKRALATIVIAAGFVGGLLVSPLGSVALERIAELLQFRDLSALDRLFRVYSGVLVFLDHPLLGVGPGGYAFYYPAMGGLDSTTMASP